MEITIQSKYIGVSEMVLYFHFPSHLVQNVLLCDGVLEQYFKGHQELGELFTCQVHIAKLTLAQRFAWNQLKNSNTPTNYNHQTYIKIT